jgi:hypothetical protein
VQPKHPVQRTGHASAGGRLYRAVNRCRASQRAMAGPREVAMLERFTSRARRVVVLATEEARSRGHESVVPEHLLMGILRDGDGMAVKVP